MKAVGLYMAVSTCLSFKLKKDGNITYFIINGVCILYDYSKVKEFQINVNFSNINDINIWMPIILNSVAYKFLTFSIIIQKGKVIGNVGDLIVGIGLGISGFDDLICFY